ncbi:hypothetical protein BDR04DRAFT_504054 [Suillus decipiens]|nr:hypothetical protein BDR04DRAFT_504054 [Suillus decipiens]
MNLRRRLHPPHLYLYNILLSAWVFRSQTSTVHLHSSMPSTELYMTPNPITLAAEQPRPAALHRTSLLTRILCFLALGRPDLDDHWMSLQSEEAFEAVRNRLCSILTSTITTAGYLTPRAPQALADPDVLPQRQASSSPQMVFLSLRALLCHTLTIRRPPLTACRSCSP